MIIDDFRIYRYRLRLKQPLVLKNRKIDFREGLAIRLTDKNNHTAWGEVAPLPGFSREDSHRAETELILLQSAINGSKIPADLLPLSYTFDNWLKSYSLSPSVRFGFESAVLNLMAQSEKQSLSSLLGDKPSTDVRVNGLLSGDKDSIINRARLLCEKGYTAFKLKVGKNPPVDASLVNQVRNIIGSNAVLRLDANRSFNIEDALLFMKDSTEFDIDYIEEPVHDFIQLKELLFQERLPVAVAFDESLLEMTPDELSSFPSIKAIVIKPTLLGLEKALTFTQAAKENGIIPVISSAFESSLGITTLVSMAAVINDADIPAGLDTLDWLQDDLLETPVRIEQGKITISNYNNINEKIRLDLLEEVVGE